METPGPHRAAEDHPIPGIISSVSHFSGSLLRHLQAFVALFALEAREAGGHAARIGVAFIGALIFAVFAYVFALLFVVFLLNTLFGIKWLWICLGVALVHAIAAGVCVWLGKSALKRKLFASTAEAVRKDIETLKATES